MLIDAFSDEGPKFEAKLKDTIGSYSLSDENIQQVILGS